MALFLQLGRLVHTDFETHESLSTCIISLSAIFPLRLSFKISSAYIMVWKQPEKIYCQPPWWSLPPWYGSFSALQVVNGCFLFHRLSLYLLKPSHGNDFQCLVWSGTSPAHLEQSKLRFPFDSILREPRVSVAHLYVCIVLFETTGQEPTIQNSTNCSMWIQLRRKSLTSFHWGDQKYLHIRLVSEVTPHECVVKQGTIFLQSHFPDSTRCSKIGPVYNNSFS